MMRNSTFHSICFFNICYIVDVCSPIRNEQQVVVEMQYMYNFTAKSYRFLTYYKALK